MDNMDRKEYVSLLETAVSTHPNAPCEKVVKWKGPGDLPTTMDNKDIDDIVDKITKGDGTTEKAIQEDTGDSNEKKEEDQAPLSILENEVDNADTIEEGSNITDQESEILDRLITEMDAMDSADVDNMLMDDLSGEEDVEVGGSEEDLELGVPQEDYELEDLD